VEIGPRFVLNPIKILSGSFFGARLYDNPTFVSPGTIRSLQRKKKAGKYVKRVMAEKQRELRKPERRLDPEELDKIFTQDEEGEGEGEDDEGYENDTSEKSEGSKKGVKGHVNTEDYQDDDSE